MKPNLLKWGILISSLLSIVAGIGFYTIGVKKEDAQRKKPTITVTKAHPIKSDSEQTETNLIQLRSGPANYFPIVGKLSKKDEYQIIDTDGQWSRVAPIRNPAAAAWTILN